MSVCVAYRVPGEGAVLVSDGRVTHDGELVSDHERKFVICGSTVCLVAGDIGPSWRALQEKPPKNFDAFREILDNGKDDTDWVAYDRRSDRLWLGEARVVTPFTTLGCGGSVALGALEVLPRALTLDAAEKNALKAVKAACRRNVNCGGKIRTVIVPRKGPLIIR